MAKASINKTVKVLLELTEHEAAFIQQLCQNSLTANEQTEHRDIRQNIWQALQPENLERIINND